MEQTPLYRALYRGISHEIDITLQVATLLADDWRAFEIRERLGISDVEYKMCIERLQHAARRI